MNSHLFETLQRSLFAFVLVISFLIILTYLLSMGLGILTIFNTTEGLKFSQGLIQIYPLRIINVEVPVNAGLYFLFLWFVFVLCFATTWKYRENLSSIVRDFFSNTRKSLLSNNLIAMPIITSMLMVATILLQYLLNQSGVPTYPLPSTDPFIDFLQFSRASLVEEMLFRIIPIGTFLSTYIFVVGKRTKPNFSWSQQVKTCILSVLQPEKAKEKVGLNTIGEHGLIDGIIWTEWAMIILTAFLFGFAHYRGWGPGKIPQAAISGAVFAIAYLYYGVQAPILLHWYFNYYFTVFNLSIDYYSTQVDFAYFLTVSANLFLGIFMWIVTIIIGVIAIFKALRRKP